MKENFADITTLHVKDFVYGPSTSTTSFTFVTNITAFGSSTVTFTKQTMYMTRGVLVGLSSVTTTNVTST